MDTEPIVTSPEELAAEQTALVLPKEEEVRAKIVEDTGFDPENEDDKPRIDKLVKREMEQREKTSAAIRAKISYRDKLPKKEGEKKVEPKPGEADKDLSTADFYALQEAKVPYEDLEEVKKASKLLGKSIADTLKDQTFIGILKTRQEERASANAMNTSGGRRSNSKATDAEVLEKAKKGEIPEQGSAEAEQLFWARRGGKK